MYSSKDILGLHLIKHFWAKNGIFGDFWAKKNWKTTHFWCHFCDFLLAGDLFTSFNYLHHHRCAGNPLTNCRRTKQFLSRLQSLKLFQSEDVELPTTYCRGMMSSLPLSYWLPGESYLTPSRTATSFFTQPSRLELKTIIRGKLFSVWQIPRGTTSDQPFSRQKQPNHLTHH